MNNLSKRIGAAVMVGILSVSCTSFAASSPFDIFESKTVIKNQEAIEARLDEFDKKLAAINDSKNKSDFDAESAFLVLKEQLSELRKEIDSNNAAYAKLLAAIEKLETAKTEQPNPQPPAALPSVYNPPVYDEAVYIPDDIDISGRYNNNNSSYLVNPGPTSEVSYTQDAINSQGNSTMVFRYAVNQLYKIYCRVNYLTDIELKKGEHLAFVGGGDTSAWAVNSSVVDGTTHIYIKPTVETSATNLIITTDKHSYQLLLNTSDWYNPMVRWTYDAEDQRDAAMAKIKNEKVVTGTLNVLSPESLDFDYEINGSGDKPVMAFNDGVKTYIKFSGRAIQGRPPLFVRSKNKNEVELVNYRVKDNYYIVEKVVDMAEIRFSDKEKTIIKHR